MLLWIAYVAAVGCAFCNGAASVLQKISADKEAKVTSLRSTGVLFRLMQDLPYIGGLAIDGLAWALTLVAVHSLPLFVVQPITSFSVVVTAVIERFAFGRRLCRQSIITIGLIVMGLVLLAVSAEPETAHAVSKTVKWVVIFSPLLLAALGALFIRNEKDRATVALAAISGLGFGGTAITGRMLSFSPSYWQVLINPLFIAMIAYGLVAILLFTLALQRHHASTVNAVMITFETLGPAIVGLFFLGDRPRPGFLMIMLLGAALALAGALMFAIKNMRETQPESLNLKA